MDATDSPPSTTQEYIFEMEGVNSSPTTPQQLRKKHVLPVLILTPEDQGKQKKQLEKKRRQDAKEAEAKEEEKKKKEEAEKREQEKLEKEQKELERERKEKEEEERLELERKRIAEEEREKELEKQRHELRRQQQALKKAPSSPRTTDESLDFSGCNIVNNPGESLEYFNLRVRRSLGSLTSCFPSPSFSSLSSFPIFSLANLLR